MAEKPLPNTKKIGGGGRPKNHASTVLKVILHNDNKYVKCHLSRSISFATPKVWFKTLSQQKNLYDQHRYFFAVQLQSKLI